MCQGVCDTLCTGLCLDVLGATGPGAADVQAAIVTHWQQLQVYTPACGSTKHLI